MQINPYSAVLDIVTPAGEDIRLTVFLDDVRDTDTDGFDEVRFCELTDCAENYAAYKKGIDLLSYGDNSKKKLVQKLRVKGYSLTSAQNAAAMLEKKGYINESEHACRLAASAARAKYGKKRIAAKLYADGFESKYIAAALEYLDENIDWDEILSEYIDSHRLGDDLLGDDTQRRKKAVAKLMNRGFDYGIISRFIKNFSAI